MKKIYSFLFVLIISISSTFAVLPNKVDFTLGLSSGIPFYGNEDLKTTIEKIENPNRILIGSFANINVNPNKYVTFFTGADILSDFCWNSDINATMVHINFPIGLKIYPNFGGFDFGLAYTLGVCSINIKDEVGDKHNTFSPWGNGFKLFAEYDFSRITKSKYFPGIGVSWGLMPRGDYAFDNTITFYILEHL